MKNNNDMMNNLIELLENNYIIEEGEKVEVIEAGNGHFEVKCGDYYLGTYAVYDNYEEVLEVATERCINILEDGLTNEVIIMAIREDLLDESYFVEAWKNIHHNMAYNDFLEDILTDDEYEVLEKGEITEDEIRENNYNTLQETIKGNEFEEYLYQFGEEETYNLIRDNNLIDSEELATYIVDLDGVASFMATYDGEELEHNEYYAYRVN